MEVRTATAGDVAGIQRVATASWHAAHDPIAGPVRVDEFLDEYYQTGHVEAILADDSTTVLVAAADAEDAEDAEATDIVEAAEDGEPADVSGFAMTGPTEDRPGVFTLGSIYVHPDRWSEGIGSRLLDRAERVAGERGAVHMRLAVMAENDRAIGFYESRGYERDDAGYDDRLDVERYFYGKDL